jgi:hypothetical protein
MQTLIEPGCGLDVHQATVVARLLIVRKDGKVQKQLRTFAPLIFPQTAKPVRWGIFRSSSTRSIRSIASCSSELRRLKRSSP